ncbi:ABC transporter permease [Actinacidiphila yeochonensis]|uniref:ABC transporter permease n=1 Tax=Actinacidiphila yeochonensis TaxID=89050 RepID=UPI0006909959|nr:ABC transporter permease [Actinacidiphila yeochonensis]
MTNVEERTTARGGGGAPPDGVPVRALAGARGRRRPRPGTVLAVLVLLLLAAVAALPWLFGDGSPLAPHLDAVLRPPSAAHPFGTDQLGRDVLTRVVYGTRTSLATGLGATALAAVAGLLVGLVAALAGGVVDAVLMRLVDALLALPALLVSLLVLTVAGRGAGAEAVAIAVPAALGYARLVRGQALSVRQSGYVRAAVCLGQRPVVLAARHVLPNTVGPLALVAAIGTGSAITSGAALSYLGLGPQPPSPEWGAMLAQGQQYLPIAWWIGVFPGLAVTVAAVAISVTGRSLHHRFAGRAAT